MVFRRCTCVVSVAIHDNNLDCVGLRRQQVSKEAYMERI